MTPIQLSTGTFLAVNVPEGAKQLQIVYAAGLPNKQQLHWYVPFKDGRYRGRRLGGVPLPPGSWSIVGTTPEILESEKLAGGVVEGHNGERPISGFRNYGAVGQVLGIGYPSATESFRSLMTANNIQINSVILRNELHNKDI